MKIQFVTHQIAEAYVMNNSITGPGINYPIIMGIGSAPPFPSETVDGIKNAAELETHFKAYIQKVRDGCTIPVQVGWFRPSNDRSRAFPGFTKLREGKDSVHINTAEIDAAAWAKYNETAKA